MPEILKRILLRGDLAVLAVLVLLLNLPAFNPFYIPTHDTMCTFQFFYLFYNNFFHHGEIAHWMPYDSFGLLSNHEQLSFLTPFSYLTILIGKILRIGDVLFLFKCSLALQQLIYLLGVYLLGRLIFVSRLATFVVGLGSLVTMSDLYYQLSYFFGIFYLLPMTAYFLLKFFQSREPEFLWLSGITVMFWETGEILYHISLWFFILSIMVGTLWWKDKGIVRCLFKRSWTNIFLFLIFLSLIFSFYYHLQDLLLHVDLRSRDAGGRNSLGMFLTWAAIYDLGHFLRWEILARPLGLLSLVFFVYALANVRHTVFFAFAACALAVLWLSFGGIFATAAYYFPTMSYYRHIGYTHRLIHLLILLVAGFGLDHVWSESRKNKAIVMGGILLLIIFLLDAFRIPGEWFTELYTSNTIAGRSLKEVLAQIKIDVNFWRMAGYGVGFFVLLFLSFCQRQRPPGAAHNGFTQTREKIFKIVLVAVALLDGSLFHASSLKDIKPLAPEYHSFADVFGVHQEKFQEMRTPEPATERQKHIMTLLMRPEAGTTYNAAYSFLQHDPCYSRFETHLLPLGFSRLLQTRKSLDADLLAVLGCHTPKLRLMSGAIFAGTVDEASGQMRVLPKLYDKLILRGVEKTLRSAWLAEPPGHVRGKIEVKKFSANGLTAEVDVASSNGAWLMYADAYHPGWRAKVNGKETPIYEAYLAFKAVRLPAGKNTVQFYFHNGWTTWISWYVAVFGVVASILFLGMFFVVLGKGI